MSAVPIVVAAILTGQSGLAEPTDAQWLACNEGPVEVRIESCTSISGGSGFTTESRAYAAATLGDLLLKIRKLEEAVSEFTRAIRIQPAYAYPHRRRAFAHYLSGRPDDALSDFNAAVNLSPLDPYVFISRSSYYRQTKQWDPARTDIERALTLDLNNPDAYYERGLLSLDIKDYEQAELDFAKILRINPGDHDSRYNLANALHHQTRNEKALHTTTQYIQAVPDDQQGFRLRGWINLDLGEFARAKADFKAALQRDPGSRSLQYALGYADWRQGKYKSALARYEKAEADYRSVSYFYYERGYARYMLNLDGQALEDADRALKINPDDYDAMWLKGATLLYLNDYPSARAILNRAAELAPANAEIPIMRGRVNIASEHYMTAVGDFSKALELAPDSQAAEIYRAFASGMAGAMTLALSTLQDILDRTPDSALANELLARLHYSKKDYSAAKHYSEKLVGLAPDHASYHVVHADILLELGEYPDAAESYRIAIAATETPPANWLRMAAYSAHKADDKDSALAYVQRASAADPEDVWTHGMLGDLLFKQSEFDGARKAYQQALKGAPDGKEKDDFRLDIAKALAGAGSLQEALDKVGPLAKRYPERADISWTRGDILFSLRRFEDALAEFEHYLSLKPSSLKAHYRLVDTLSALKRFSQAAEQADTIVYLEENKAAAYLTRGKLYLELEDFEGAASDLVRAVDLDPDNVVMKVLHARALIGLGKPEEALAVLGDVPSAGSEQANLLYLTARAQEMLGRSDAAAQALEAARMLNNGVVSPQTIGLRKDLR